MHSSVEIAVVDAFTALPFSGNPAGVCLLDGPAAEDWMQAVAREVNLSETAFVHEEGSGYRLRWFTPLVEVELCGHATLATAHVLFEEGRVAEGETARFSTLSGGLTAARSSAAPEWIVLDFPSIPTSPSAPPAGLLEAMGLTRAVYVGRTGADFLVQLETASEVRGLRPDFSRLPEVEVRTVAVTAPAADGPPDAGLGRGWSDRPDVVTRFFAPRMGVPEDPVTGYAHCLVGPYWQAVWGRSDLLAYQASERGGFLRVSVRGDRVHLGGQAVTVIRGRVLAVPAV